MHRTSLTAAFAAVLLLTAACAATPPPRPPLKVITLEQAIALPSRAEANRARDVYRHPQETLEFFGIADDMTVVEIWPGAGWYTEILAPYLRARGQYVAAHTVDGPQASEGARRGLQAYKAKLAADPELYDGVKLAAIGTPDQWQPVAPGTADLVLTFRNVHNWLSSGTEREMFAAFFRSLKSGGVLGVVEHRAKPGTTKAESIKSGYVDQDYVVKLATEAGFKFAAWEEINANPKDSKDHPAGVWTLPPVLRLGDQDREKYLAIGESDRMTLKFIKP
jgi:predicted methyltransferase